MNRDEAITLGLACAIGLLTARVQATMRRRFKTWTPAIGVVTRLLPEEGGRNHATIRYENGSGAMGEFSGTTLPDTFKVGSEIPLLYCPKTGKVMTNLPGERHIPVAIGYFFAGFLLILFICFRYGNRVG